MNGKYKSNGKKLNGKSDGKKKEMGKFKRRLGTERPGKRETKENRSPGSWNTKQSFAELLSVSLSVAGHNKISGQLQEIQQEI